MTWNYRVIKMENGIPEDDGHVFQFHEVYYEEDGTISSWTVEPVSPFGESPSELATTMKMFEAALDKPVLREVSQNGTTTLVEA